MRFCGCGVGCIISGLVGQSIIMYCHGIIEFQFLETIKDPIAFSFESLLQYEDITLGICLFQN